MHIPPTLSKRRKLSLTPLIDVIFLLLLFFMLSSTFSRFSEIEIGSGNEGVGSTPSEVAFLVLNSQGLTINGDEITKDQLLAKITESQQAGREALVLLVSGDVTSQEFISILQLAKTGPLPVSMARRGE